MKVTKSQWLTLALVLSLGGNLYAGTYFLGHHTHQHVVAANLARKQVEGFINTLPRDKQADIRKNIKGDMEQLRVDLAKAKQDREKLAQLLMAPDLDKEAINAQLAEMRDQSVESQEKVQSIMLNAFEQMTPEERKNAIEHLSTEHSPERKF